MFKRKMLCLAVVFALLITSLTGCGGKEEGAGTKDAASEKQQTLTVATAYDAKTLDPHVTNDIPSSSVMIQIYENLLTLDENNELVGQLAEKWERIDDVTYKFYLKKGVKFHNGEELKASDVKFSFERAITKEGSAVTHVVKEIDPNGFEVVDDHTIIIKLKRPFSVFLTYLTHVGGGVILNEKAVTEAGDDYGMNPVGTGPYKFKSWAKGDNIVLERFDDHREIKPQFKEIVLRAIPEATSRTIELESGGVDISYMIVPNDVPRVDENPDLNLLRSVNLNTQYLGFNCEKAPFDNVKVRQAINLALNVEAITKSAFRGIGKAAVGPIGPGAKYFNKNLTVKKKNVEEAKKLLAEAGYENGFDTQIWTNDRKERIDMATIIQNQLKEIGINAEIKVLEWSAYLEGLKKSEQEMFIVGWTMSAPDPDMGLYALFHSSQKGSNNFAYYGNEEMDKMLDQGRVMDDSKEREQLYYDIQQKLYDENPWVFLYNGEETAATRKGIKGFKPSPMGYHILYNTYIEE
ncbi:ABC transporter substrate-binding protein [Wukongibacter baidiensis]|uniref:ABC transporter substrate-binding protein n=1 Tax=Wukongibacter baidiensis TaxID=1723361 RepID=UPI003D7F3C00